MPLERCPNGHFFDPAKHTACPYCGVPDLQMDRTMPKRDLPPARVEPGQPPAVPVPVPQPPPPVRPREEGATVALGRAKAGGPDPVVGWLVCVAGPDRGCDYRLHAERNFIGRADSNDVCIAGDASISRDRHAEVCFDPRNFRFDIVAGGGRGIIYLNGQPVHTSAELKARDTVDIGQTRLLFVPLCDEKFGWDNA